MSDAAKGFCVCAIAATAYLVAINTFPPVGHVIAGFFIGYGSASFVGDVEKL